MYLEEIEGMDDFPAIALDRVTMKYGKKIALNNVSLDVPRGAVYALLGRNGAGKSSAIRCLLGQQKPTQGHIFIFHQDSWQYREKVMETVGVVPEEPNAPPDMTAKQLAFFCAKLYPYWDSKGVAMRFKRFGVPLDVAFGRLSKGQKGQVALALALGSSPKLLILDDPTLGLDLVARREVFEELVGELADRGTTVLITTHDLAGVEGIADRVGILKQGELVIDEEIETLKAKFRRIRYTNNNATKEVEVDSELNLLKAIQVKKRGWGVEAIVAEYDDDCLARIISLTGNDPEVSAMSLEEIFIAVVGENRGE